MFEQSLLLHDTKKPWNFLASLSAELLIVSLALLIPLLYRDHLPAFHWKDITMGPAPLARPPVEPAPANRSTAKLTIAMRPLFRLEGRMTSQPAPVSSVDLAPDAPPAIGIASPDGLGGSNNMLGRFIPNVVAAPPPPKPEPVVSKPAAAPVPVGGDVQMAKLVRKVIPEYPALARNARISGVVQLVGIIGKDGAIRNLQFVSGPPLLARAAMEAVQQWIYKPTLLNGNAVEVIAPIEVRFTLSQ